MYHKKNPNQKSIVSVHIGLILTPYTDYALDNPFLLSLETTNLGFRDKAITDYLYQKNYPYLMTYEAYRTLVSSSYIFNSLLKEVYKKKPVVVTLTSYIYAEERDNLTFAKNLKHTPLSEGKKAYIFFDLMSKISVLLKKLRSDGFIHGNIKPENIYVIDCPDKKSGKCPLISNWKYGTDISQFDKIIRYSNGYRPIEMYLFKNHNQNIINIDPGYYQGTGTEDVFAFAIMMKELLVAADIDTDFFKDFNQLINSIIYPLTFKDLYNYNINNIEDIFYNSDIMTKIRSVIDDDYVDKVRSLIANAHNIEVLRNNEYDSVEMVKRLFVEQSAVSDILLIAVFARLEHYFNSFKINGFHELNNQIDQFYQTKTELIAINP